jgi:hypothetical protein
MSTKLSSKLNVLPAVLEGGPKLKTTSDELGSLLRKTQLADDSEVDFTDQSSRINSSLSKSVTEPIERTEIWSAGRWNSYLLLKNTGGVFGGAYTTSGAIVMSKGGSIVLIVSLIVPRMKTVKILPIRLLSLASISILVGVKRARSG